MLLYTLFKPLAWNIILILIVRVFFSAIWYKSFIIIFSHDLWKMCVLKRNCYQPFGSQCGWVMTLCSFLWGVNWKHLKISFLLWNARLCFQWRHFGHQGADREEVVSLHWPPRLTAHLHVPFPPWLVRPLPTFLYKAGEKIEDIVSTPGTYLQYI